MTVAVVALALLVVATPIQAWDSESAEEPVCNTESADSATCQGEGKVVDDSGCTDEHVKCGEWADLGECGKYIWLRLLGHTMDTWVPLPHILFSFVNSIVSGQPSVHAKQLPKVLRRLRRSFRTVV